MQPNPYVPTTHFSQEETGGVAGRSTSRTTAIDAEFTNLATTIAQILTDLAILQRDDTELRDGIVKGHTLSAAVLAMIGSAGGSRWNPRGLWLTATNYAAYDFVESGGSSYLCLTTHTSGVFATDRTAGKWMTISADSAAFAALVAAYQADMASTTDVAKGDALVGVKKTVTAAVGTTQHEVNEREVNSFDLMTPAQIADVIARTQLVDVSVPLQAFMTAFVAGQRRGVMAAGDYLCATMPTIGTGSGSTFMGMTLEGAGPGYSSGGSRIIVSGVGKTAILTVKKDANRGLSIRNLGLICATDAAAYGLLFDSSEISQPRVDNINIGGATKAIGLLTGTGANGEFPQFHNVRANDFSTFFYMTTGQAYKPLFIGGWANGRVGGTLFHYQLSAQGGGLDVHGFNSTFTTGANGVGNATLLKLTGGAAAVSSSYIFNGGRHEHITCIVDRNSSNNGSETDLTCEFNSVEFTIDNRKGHVDNTINTVLRISTIGTGPADTYTFRNCRFVADSADVVFNITVPASARGRIDFINCTFNGFKQLPYVDGAYNTAMVVEFKDCIANYASNTGALATQVRPMDFSRKYGGDYFPVANILARSLYSRAAQAPSGKCINYLQIPQYREANGSVGAVAADAPWAHGGTTATFSSINDWTGGAPPKSPSPWAKKVRLPATSYVYQDMPGINLNAANTSSGGVNGHFVAYQALMKFGGASTIKFTLENSVSGQIYDQVTLAAFGAGGNYPQLITLAATCDLTATGNLRLKQENTGAGNLDMDVSWQMVTDEPESVFVGTSAAAVVGTVNWAAVMESSRVLSRLAIPYKTDYFGATAAPAHTDLQSDHYLSKTTELQTYYANAGWHRVPQSRTNTTAVGNIGAGEDDLQTASVPAATLFANGHTIVVDAYGSCANNANAKTLKLYFGATALINQVMTAGQASRWHIRAEITRTGASTQDWVVHITQAGTTTIHDVQVGTAAITDTAAITIKCTGTAVADNDIVQEFLRVCYAD